MDKAQGKNKNTSLICAMLKMHQMNSCYKWQKERDSTSANIKSKDSLKYVSRRCDIASVRDDVSKYIKKKYKASPEYLWKRYPSFAIYRHEDNRKWFALIATISRDKLGIDSTDEVDVLNVKIDDLMLRDILLQHPGFILDIT